MKRIIFPLLFLMAIAMQSCSDGLDRHELSVVYPNGYALFADQTQDSLVFLTFDSWRVSSNASWITVTGKSSDNIKYDYYKNYLIRVDLALEPNTTGHTRAGNVTVKSYDYAVPDGADFVLRDSADVVSDSLCFNVQKEWTLTFAPGADQSWLQLSATSGAAGYNAVPITLEQNLKPQERRTELLLTSSGITNQISVVQAKAKK